MKTLSLIILLWVYAVSITGFIEIFKILSKDLLIINYNSEYLGIIFGIIGLGLGTVFYFLSNLPKKIKTTILIGIPSTILLIILFSYLIADIEGFITVLYNLLKIGIFFLVSGLPSIAIYSVLKNQKNVLLACGAGIMIFFFMIVFLSQITKLNLLPIYTENQMILLLLFFILFLAFLELGSNSINYTNSLKKMIPNQFIDQNTLFRFNRVINKQIAYIGLILIACFSGSFILLWNNTYSKFLKIDNIFGVEITSYFGILLLVFFILIGLTLLWFLIPQEEKKEYLNEF
jgi:hypothetical protein